MSKTEIRGLLKGIGVAMVICATIFYSLILNYRAETALERFMSEDEIIIAARDLGMIFESELHEVVTDEDMDEESMEEPKE